jgi:hypothetical protein
VGGANPYGTTVSLANLGKTLLSTGGRGARCRSAPNDARGIAFGFVRFIVLLRGS